MEVMGTMDSDCMMNSYSMSILQTIMEVATTITEVMVVVDDTDIIKSSTDIKNTSPEFGGGIFDIRVSVLLN